MIITAIILIGLSRRTRQTLFYLLGSLILSPILRGRPSGVGAPWWWHWCQASALGRHVNGPGCGKQESA